MKKPFLILLLSLTLPIGCIDSNKTLRILDEAECRMIDHPDSALTILRSVDRRTLHTRREQARFALLCTQALDKNCIEVDRDTLIRTALRYYRHRGPKRERALAYFYSERIYENRHHIDSAIVQIEKAEKFAQQTDDLYLKGLIANTFAILYESQNFVEQAKDKYLEAADYFSRIGHKENLLGNYIGAIRKFRILKDYPNQILYYSVAKEIAFELKDTLALISLEHFHANRIIDEKRDYKKALTILQTANTKYNSGDTHLSYYFILSDIYINLNKPDSSLFYLRPFIEQTEGEQTRDRLEIAYLTGVALKMSGRYEQAYRYNHEALAISDTLYFREKKESIPALKEKYKAEQLIMQNNYLKKSKRYQSCIVGVVSITILFISLWVSSQRKKQILLQEQKISDYRNAMSRLKTEYETFRLSQKTENPAIAPEIVERRIAFLKQILDTTAHYNHDKELFYAKIEQLLTQNGGAQNKKGANEMFLLFQDILNARHPGVIDRLQQLHPQLTAQEVGMYCMICMEMSKSAICLVLKIRLKTYYNYRNILRCKLGITNEELTIPQHFETFCKQQPQNDRH
ncbi:MAG: hypothetical protein NC209_05910 [Alistipes sp.]|nr:hypothetical protein [Alistipes senegalensis]MCM1250659.1 hypothetical protein [Alistipes sp.]